ncbi:hypothetical protein KBD33_05950 [Candidatus Gracilibacteria bacterium]|nr:hypothetical protein [Candidatus Gracilibacteria bacterium]
MFFKGSSYDKILQAMQEDVDRKLMVRDFQRGEYFIGYKAGTRINELMKLGYIKSEKIEGSSYHMYSLTEKGLEYIPEYKVAKDVSYIFEKETNMQAFVRNMKDFFTF